MKTRKLHKRERWRICKILWDEFLAAGEYPAKQSSQVQYDWYEDLARKILQKYSEISIDMLKIFDDWILPIRFFNGKRKYVQFEKLSWNEEISRNMFSVLSLTQAIENVLNNHKPVIIHYEKPRRMVAPPLSAYEPIPFNKMDIKHDGNSYALLFDPYF